jgi:hypothetical protein
LSSTRERNVAVGGRDPGTLGGNRRQDPLFASIDGMNGSHLQAGDPRAHSLLLERGLFRIFLPWPLRHAPILQKILDASRRSRGTHIAITGYRVASLLSNATTMIERADVGRRRAEPIEELLRGAGLTDVRYEVRWEDRSRRPTASVTSRTAASRLRSRRADPVGLMRLG